MSHERSPSVVGGVRPALTPDIKETGMADYSDDITYAGYTPEDGVYDPATVLVGDTIEADGHYWVVREVRADHIEVERTEHGGLHPDAIGQHGGLHPDAIGLGRAGGCRP